MAVSSIVSLTRFYFSTSLSASSNSIFHFNHINRRLIAAVSARRQHWSCKRMASSSLDKEVPAKQNKFTAPYGSWNSPITADVVSGSSKRLGGTAVDSHGSLIWLESRPDESGSVYTKYSTLCHYLYVYMLPISFNFRIMVKWLNSLFISIRIRVNRLNSPFISLSFLE